MVSLREVQHANREPDRPWDHQETAGGGNRTYGASQSCPDADRDTDDVRSRHELAETDDVGESGLAYPPALVDGDAMRPDEPAAEPAQRDLAIKSAPSGTGSGNVRSAAVWNITGPRMVREHQANVEPRIAKERSIP